MADYTWAVTNSDGYDGDMIVRQYTSFNLDSGNTLQPANRSRGVMIFVDGDATINGTIYVYGGYGGTPADNSWNMHWIKSGQTGSFTNSTSEWGNGSTGANGIHSDLTDIFSKMPVTSSNSFNVFSGSNTGDGSGGTGYGGSAGNNPTDSKNQGSPYAGGAGGNGDIGAGDSEQRYGGRGGNGQTGGAYPMGSGAGNPSGSPFSGANFSGGLFFLAARGDINGSGSINCAGGNGGSAGWGGSEPLYSYGGGGSGGGRIILLAGGTVSGSITTNVTGGNGGSGNSGAKNLKINGGRGSHGTTQIVSGIGA